MNVYVISNESFDGWVKVGKSHDTSKRLRQLQTGSPTEYVVEYETEFWDDRPVHWHLNGMGIERSGEWFKCDVETAVEAIETVITDMPEHLREYYSSRAKYDAWFNDTSEVRFA